MNLVTRARRHLIKQLSLIFAFWAAFGLAVFHVRHNPAAIAFVFLAFWAATVVVYNILRGRGEDL